MAIVKSVFDWIQYGLVYQELIQFDQYLFCWAVPLQTLVTMINIWTTSYFYISIGSLCKTNLEPGTTNWIEAPFHAVLSNLHYLLLFGWMCIGPWLLAVGVSDNTPNHPTTQPGDSD